MKKINPLSYLMFKTYKSKRTAIRRIILNWVCKMENGEFNSNTLRKIFKTYHEVDIGLYTHGGCFIPGNFDRNTQLGRYCSIARTARGFNRNHPLEFKSMHAFFFNRTLGICDIDPIDYTPLKVGNDVWLGYNSIVLPNVRNICHGAVVAAGAVVNKDIPPYGVAVGNPARVVRYRFPDHVINDLLKSSWWDEPIEELGKSINEFQNFLSTKGKEI